MSCNHEATEEEIKNYKETALSKNTYWNNNLLSLDSILEFKDGYKVNVKSIIDIWTSKCYISPPLIALKYIESDLYKAEVKDTFDKITILENKLINCTIIFDNMEYSVPLFE